MPAIQVARTDTFEQQRQKINQLGSTLFNITAGGSDLSTGNLKLGDGTVSTPSLSFVSESGLGLYKPTNNQIEYVSSGKKLFNISSEKITYYKDSFFTQSYLSTNGVFVFASGSNYEGGTYVNLDLLGGTGSGAKATIDVVPFSGSITTEGKGYNPGSYSNVSLLGGTGSGTTVGFTVDGINNGSITGGSGYTNGFYQNIPLSSSTGTGSGAIADIAVVGGLVVSVSFSSQGSGYKNGDILTTANTNIGGTGSGFLYTITTYPGIIDDISFATRGTGYTVGDQLSLPVAVTGISTNLPGIKSNVSTTLSTSSSQITVSSTSGIVAGMLITQAPGGDGSINPISTVVSVDSLTTLTMSSAPLSSGAASLTFTSPQTQQITVADSSVFRNGDVLTVTSGTGQLDSGTVVNTVINSTTIFISKVPLLAGPATITATPPYGVGSQLFKYTINSIGTVGGVLITNGGNGYSDNDQLTINPTDLVQDITYTVTSQLVEKVTFSPAIPSSRFQVGQKVKLQGGISEQDVYYVKSTSGNIDYIIIGTLGLSSGNIIENASNASLTGTVDTAVTKNKFFINTGNGSVIHPNLTLYAGNTYVINFPSDHPLYFSRSRDGKWGPGNITGISATVSTTSKTINVSSTVGILVGMSVTEFGIGVGNVATDTVVESIVDQTSITVNNFPTTSGSLILNFTGAPYSDNIVRQSNSLKFRVTESTPSTLYYYCNNHPDMGGEDNDESVLTISTNNPRVFGQGAIIKVIQVQKLDIIELNVGTGEITSSSLLTQNIDSDNITNSSIISTNILESTSAVKTNILQALSGNTISVNSSVSLQGNLEVGSNVLISSSTGNITTSGILSVNNTLNVNNILSISNNIIASSGSNDIILSPPTGRVAKILSTTSLNIPSGSTAQRPSGSVVGNGSIRFNTDTNQYEGYSGTTSSWSSLGGVRDLDGNTYITAEFTIGSNDNTLWFYNDNNNTVKFTPEYQEFVSVKKIRSINTSAPTFVNWAANTPVTVGQYLKYKNNIYEVVIAGVTGTSGNEPTSTTGTNFANGTATLKFFITAVAPLTFEEISEVRIAPDGGTSLSINNDLRFETNVISTDINDLLLRPNSGKKVTVDAKTSLVLPVGTTNERGAPVRGSVRFNTTILQYEGYDGANWSSLGGVRDVDGNTYIIPELTPGGNQNILYFYNNGSNTLRVTENEIQLDTIDTITSLTSNALNLEASLVTFNNLAASIDTSSATTTFISTTKDNLDLGLSSGIVNDPLLRLSDTGDIFYNLGFGTGVFNGIKIFDKGLKELELADYKILTEDVTLTKNTVNVGSSIAYDPSIHRSAKVQIVAHNETTGDKEFLEYSVIDKGSDIFHTDFGNVKTGAELISSVFDFDANNRVRVTFTLDSAISAGNVVKVTVISNIIKR